MTETQKFVEGLPTVRRCPFDPPAELAELRREGPISRMAYPDGHRGWLVTGDELARTVLTHPALSSLQELRHHPVPFPVPPAAAPPGVFIGMDPPEHTRLRKPLSKTFTARRVRALEPAIARIADECLDAMDREGPPADLMQSFALPLPVLVISELLGAPAEVAAELQALRVPVLLPGTPPQEVGAAMKRTNELFHELVALRRSHPSDDLLSELIAEGGLSEPELAGIAFLILVAGHETTANMIALGTWYLLENPEKRAALDLSQPLPERTANELLRYLSAVQYTSRAALEDLELGGVTVRKGETVTLSLPGVNRDPARYSIPDEFQPEGAGPSNLAFGYGIHQCIGHNLARTEIRMGIPALLSRFPELTVTTPRDEIPTREAMNTFGVESMPVTW